MKTKTELPTCEACASYGWLMRLNGTIERCDLCEAFETDMHAQEYVKQAAQAFADQTRGADFSPLSCPNPYEIQLGSAYARAKEELDVDPIFA